MFNATVKYPGSAQIVYFATIFIHPVLFYSVRQYLENFVRREPTGYGEYCTERLRRIIANGERKELPCWLEQQVETLNHIFVV